jgi:anti-sigma factor RsiW
MNVPLSPQPELPALREQLVAYLDGELDADASQRIDELLSTDPRVRQELSQLERTWDLLDRLPRAEVDQSFTQSTVEMIAVSAAAEVDQEEAALPRRRRRGILLGAGGMLAAALAGYWFAGELLPNQNERLLRDLPVIEDLEAYRQATDLDFLKKLKEEGVFNDYQPGDPDA